MSDVGFQAFKSVFVVYGTAGVFVLLAACIIAYFCRHALLKWIENRFQQQLEAYKADAQSTLEDQKHELQKIMEDKKYDINSRFDRNTRINHLEYSMLPDLWYKLNEALVASQNLIGLRTYADILKMDDARLKRHLQLLEFTEDQADDVVNASDKPTTYRKIVDFRDLWTAKDKFNEFAISLRKSSIFIRPELFDSFRNFEDIIKSALIENDMNLKGLNQYHSFQHGSRLLEAMNNDIQSFGDEVRDRLWNSIATGAA